MRLYKRGDVYWFELRFNNQQIRRSTKSRNHKIAGQLASAYHVALIKGEMGILERKPVPRFAAAMKAFLEWSDQEHIEHPATAVRYRDSSIPLLKHFKDAPLDKITPDDVEGYKARRSREHSPQSKKSPKRLRPATVNRELACLRRMFNHIGKAHHDLLNPVSRVDFLEEDNQQTRVLSFAEQTKYLAACTPLLFDIATLILETGMRPGEVFELVPRNVDLEERWLRVLKGKTKAAKRQIHLTAAACAVLAKRCAAAAGDAYIFPCERDAARAIDSVQSAHGRALRDSKVAHFRPYDLRHTWATRAAQSGIDLVTLAAMMGHSRIQMVLRYAHPTQDHQAAAMGKMEEYTAALRKKERVKAEELADLKASTGLRIVPRTG